MLRNSLFLVIACLFAFASCERKAGPTKACFDLSKDKVKPGDSVYLLNCSENYNKFIWLHPNGVDSINRHTVFPAGAPGTYEIILYVGDYDFYVGSYDNASLEKKVLTVE